MRALIADDEPIARKILREELELLPDIAIIGEAENGLQALDLIRAHRPELVFLDLQMPLMGGLDVVRHLEGATLPVVVIVTAYDQYAIQAFEAGAIDYLLKPIAQSRLHQALARARMLRQSGLRVAESVVRLQEVTAPRALPLSRKIIGRLGEEYFLLSPEEVFAFQAEGDLVWILTAKQKFLATQTLKSIQERLTGGSFERMHRNALVNVDHVRKMAALSSQRWLITLLNGQEFTVSKRQAQTIRRLLQG